MVLRDANATEMDGTEKKEEKELSSRLKSPFKDLRMRKNYFFYIILDD